MNTAAIRRPELVAEIADRFGSQVLVLQRRRPPRAAGTDCGFEVTTHGGRTCAGLDAIEWAVRAAELGAGEILLNAMDADGTTRTASTSSSSRAVRREVERPGHRQRGSGRRRALPAGRRRGRRRRAGRHGLPLRHPADRRRQGRSVQPRATRSAELGTRRRGSGHADDRPCAPDPAPRLATSRPRPSLLTACGAPRDEADTGTDASSRRRPTAAGLPTSALPTRWTPSPTAC